MRLVPLFFLAVLAACASSKGEFPAEQEAVDRVAKRHPDLMRLTLHKVPPGKTQCTQVASTMAERRGKPSDPEDLEAMRTGKQIVLDEPGAVDVTVPVLMQGGKPTAIAGVTLRAGAGANRDALVKKAGAIAQELATELQAGKGP